MYNDSFCNLGAMGEGGVWGVERVAGGERRDIDIAFFKDRGDTVVNRMQKERETIGEGEREGGEEGDARAYLDARAYSRRETLSLNARPEPYRD